MSGIRELCLKLFVYDESSPTCLRRADKGNQVGFIMANGYRYVSVYPTGKLASLVQVKVSRVVMWLHGHDVDGKVVDHINHNTLCDKYSNLRIGTQQQNTRNQKLSKANTSGHKGVSWCSQKHKWLVRVNTGRCYKFFGRYDDFELACLVADEARNKYHKEFACHG